MGKAGFLGGMVFAALRVREKRWSIWRRLLYIGGAPLIPLVRLLRIIKEINRTGRQRKLIPQILPALISGLVPHAMGELIGYAFGLSNVELHYSYYEMTRIRHLTTEDRKIVAC